MRQWEFARAQNIAETAQTLDHYVRGAIDGRTANSFDGEISTKEPENIGSDLRTWKRLAENVELKK